MSYTANVRFAFHTPEGGNGFAIQTVNVEKKSDAYVIIALKKLFGRADYYLVDVEWEKQAQ